MFNYLPGWAARVAATLGVGTGSAICSQLNGLLPKSGKRARRARSTSEALGIGWNAISERVHQAIYWFGQQAVKGC